MESHSLYKYAIIEILYTIKVYLRNAAKFSHEIRFLKLNLE